MITDILAARSRCLKARTRFPGFTLVEVMVSMVILLMMLLIVTQVIDTAQKTWRQASSRLSQFREARTAFDTVTRNLAQATLNPYRVYDYGPGSTPGVPGSDPLTPPLGYVRTTQLGFVMGDPTKDNIFAGLGTPIGGHAVLFQAPLGYTKDANYRQLNSLLCARGYFVRFSTDQQYLPVGLESRLEVKARFRLYEYRPPTESNMVYLANDPEAWTKVNNTDAINPANTHPVAENIVSLILAPSFAGDTSAVAATGGIVPVGNAPLAGRYSFSSYDPASKGLPATLKDRLPSSIRVVMIAIDEASAVQLQQRFSKNAPRLFSASFTSPATLANDLKIVRESLLNLHVNYRIFSTTVNLPAADN